MAYDIDSIFRYHPPVNGQAELYLEIREAGRSLAATVLKDCPDSRERSLALTKIEEAVMWANASIARNGGK